MEIYLIGNAHIDPVWLWRWPEGMQVVRATCKAVLDLMERYPHFKFSFSSAIFYKWLLENEPEMFERIKRYVQEGRWEIVGGWIVEPDCNIPCGESFVRHSLYGQLFFKRTFGKMAKVGYNPDSFGHNASLPQILVKSGMQFYVFMRPAPQEKELPSHIFRWRSRDGSSVIAYRIPFSYATRTDDLKPYVERFLKELEDKLERAMFFYGEGDHGGGPTEENIKSLEKMGKEITHHRFLFATTEEFFQKVKTQEYPLIEDELQHHARGCYTSCSVIKTLNRRVENALLGGEKLATLSYILTQKPYPKDEFRKAWENLLFCQFHDILAGSSIPPAYEDAKNSLASSLYTADKFAHYAMQSIARKTKVEGQSVVVFNVSSWRRIEGIEVELSGWNANSLKVISPWGESQEAQEIQSFSLTGMRRFLFLAEVPPLGYAVYELLPSEAEYHPSPKMENEILCVEFDGEGYISLFKDKLNNVEPLKYPALVPLVMDDPGDAWGHNVDCFRNILGRFQAVEHKWIETGPIRWKFRIKSRYGDSTLWQDFVLYKGLPFLDVQVKLLWNEKHKMLKISLPTTWEDSQATFSIPYGFIVREQTGEEEPLSQWMNIDRKDGSYGVAFINDSKYGGDVYGGEMRLSVIRSPVYAHHIPRQLEKEREYLYMDQGLHYFSYRIYPHKGDWKEGKVVHKAEEFNSPLYYMIEHPHEGDLPNRLSLLEILPSNVILSALKLAEEEEAIIFRLWEAEGKETSASLKLGFPSSEWEGTFAPSEIKTLKLCLPSLQWEETNLLEV